MSDLNDVKIFGRIVRDAMMKETATGIKILEFSIANNQTYKDEKGEYVQTAHFFPLAIYGTYAEKMLPHLKRGQRVIIEGWLKQNRWINSDGKSRSVTAIGVRKIHIVWDSKKNENSEQTAIAEAQQVSNVNEEFQTLDFSEQQLADMYDSDPSDDDFIPAEDNYSDGDAIF